MFVVEANQPVSKGHHGVSLYNSQRQLIWGNAVNDLEFDRGIQQLVHHLPTLPLKPEVYTWRVTFWDDNTILDDWECVPEMLVATQPLTHPRDEWAGILNVPSGFSLSSPPNN